MKSLPNQEPVERWELEFDEKFNSIAVFYDEKNKEYFAAILPKDRVENDEYGLEDIKKFISHQKALSRAEVIKELINKKEDIDQAWTRYGGGRTYGEFVRDYLEQAI